ncbi:MAG: toll/interleukin-1 receptor domain-containing protein [Solirubrobacteraceae bacterium]
MFAPTSVSPVFISYRRADARHAAARLRDSLTDLEHRVWFDIDDIPSAMPYRAQIAAALRQCDVALVVIGPQWLTVSDAEGHRRLNDPDDDVRLEIAQALARTDVTLVPVLVDNAEMPPRGELPPDLQPLCDLNAARLSHESWRYQVQALHATIEVAARRGWSAWGEALGVAMLGALVHGVPTYWFGDDLPSTPTLTLSDGSEQAFARALAFTVGFAVTGAGIGALVGAAWNPPGVVRGLVAGGLAAGLVAFGVRWANGGQASFGAEMLGAGLIALGAVAAAVAVQWLTRVTRARAVRA